MEMSVIYNLIYTKLLAKCPKDTWNMVNNIAFLDYGDYVEIKIDVDYASWVNTNGKYARGAKEIANFHWVEDVLKEASEVIGGKVEYELS